MRKLTGVLVIAYLLFPAVPSSAHHAFAAEFDSKQPIALKGTLTKVEWINPHGWIHLDVKGLDGKVENWAIETGTPNSLMRKGLRITDFPVGIELTVTGYRAKNGSHIANGVTVKYPDGREFFTGSSGTGIPAEGSRPGAK